MNQANTPLARIATHHAQHIYKRGCHTGDAPLYKDKRWKSSIRITRLMSGSYTIRMHNTDILTITPDGVTIDCDGWADHPTTRTAVNDALSRLGIRMSLYKRKRYGYSQVQVTAGGKYYRYYDGMTLDNLGFITSPLKPFEARKLDSEAGAEFKRDIAESGFKDVFRVIQAALPEGRERYKEGWRGGVARIPELISNTHHSNQWQLVIRYFSYLTYWSYTFGTQQTIKRSPSATWTLLMRTCKAQMYKVVTTDETVILM